MNEDDKRGLLEADEDYDFEIVGESHYQDALADIAGPKTEAGVWHETLAGLIPEASNPYDPNAVAIIIDGKKVGHLSRDYAVEYRDFLDETSSHDLPILARAVIMGGFSRRGRDGSYGVRLNILWPPDFDEDYTVR